ncbi:threonine synthase [Patescibacteria group bacterium]|nr:threonine synthase [Patescibacteria group bacterium]
MKEIVDIYPTYLRCIGCGYVTDLLKERKFFCPRCDNLFDVIHDFSQYEYGNFNVYTKMFNSRASASHFFCNDNSPLLRSGVWRFWEWIMPNLPINQIITLNEGNVPIVPAGKNLQDWVGPIDLWLILEGMTPTGSFKDFGGTVMISVAKAAGIKAIGCASTGDTSAMAAAYASAAGMKCVVVLPRGKITPAQLAQPLVYGAMVITIPGSFDDCMRIVRELVQAELLFPANSLNPTRIEGHQATVFLTAQFFDWDLPDWFVLPVGNGSNCSSVGKAMRLMKQLGYAGNMSKILGCQSTAANPLASSWIQAKSAFGNVSVDSWSIKYTPQEHVGETTATAALIGKPVSWRKVIREIVASNGAMNTVPEQLLNEAVAVWGRDGHFVCPQTGTALAGVKLAVKNGMIAKGSRVVVISTANGIKFTESAAAGLEKTIIEADDCQTETIAKIMGL